MCQPLKKHVLNDCDFKILMMIINYFRCQRIVIILPQSVILSTA